jgi:hypothetical protein
MTDRADLAAALGVDVSSVGEDAWGDPVCTIGDVTWAVDRSALPNIPDSLRYEGPDDEVHQIPITTTLPAAVARVRRMLEVP